MAASKGSGTLLTNSKTSNYSIILPVSEKPRSPGPALYGPSNITLVKRASPQYSIAPRMRKRISQHHTPAANFYDRSNYKPGKTSPSFSFGMRYSNRSPPLIIPDYVKHG